MPVCRSVTFTCRQPSAGFGGNRFVRFCNHLLVEAHDRALGIARSLIAFQHVFQPGDKGCAGVGCDHPLLLQMRLESAFLSVRPMGLSLVRSTICGSTTFSASGRKFHLAQPSGAGPHVSVDQFCCRHVKKPSSRGVRVMFAGQDSLETLASAPRRPGCRSSRRLPPTGLPSTGSSSTTLPNACPCRSYPQAVRVSTRSVGQRIS
jgi:hypothetical protein